jgi:hypothetical protein
MPGLCRSVEVKQIKDEIDEVGVTLSFRSILDQRERGDAVRPHPEQLAVEIGLPRRELSERCGDRRIFAEPVKPGAGRRTGRACDSRRI